MNCDDCIEFLMHYLDGELAPEQRQTFVEHLRACPECVVYLETYRLTISVSRVACEVREEPCERVPEDRARAERPLLALDRHVAREPRDVRLPRQDRQRGRIRHRDHVGVVRPLADVAGGESGESRPFHGHVVHVGGRDQLGLRNAAHLDERAQKELEPLLDLAADLAEQPTFGIELRE